MMHILSDYVYLLAVNKCHQISSLFLELHDVLSRKCLFTLWIHIIHEVKKESKYHNKIANKNLSATFLSNVP